MKSNLLAIGVLVGGITLLFTDQAIGFSVKPPGGRTGSLVDGGKSCMDGCHVGSVTPVSSGISTDIPTEGYVAGQTYSVTVGSGLALPGIGKYGFQFSAQDASGNQMGELNSIAFGGTSNYIPEKYIAHSAPLLTDNPSWTFEWTAPTTGSGEVTFYAAVVAANNNSSTSGDAVLTTSSSVSEQSALSAATIKSSNNIQASIKGETMTLHYQSIEEASYSVKLFDLNGKLLYQGNLLLEKGTGSKIVRLNQQLSHGIFALNLQSDEVVTSMKIVSKP